MTATTVTTATTATTATTVTPEAVAVFGVVAVVLLITLLIVKELSGASENPKAQQLARHINISATPLLLAFGAIVVSKVMAALG